MIGGIGPAEMAQAARASAASSVADVTHGGQQPVEQSHQSATNKIPEQLSSQAAYAVGSEDIPYIPSKGQIITKSQAAHVLSEVYTRDPNTLASACSVA